MRTVRRPLLCLGILLVPGALHAQASASFWNNETSARWELILALLGFALLTWGAVLRRRGWPEAFERLRSGLLAVLGVIALLTYFNFGFFHFGNFIHDWEWTHYYLGSKFFHELSYDRLYECIAIADSEDGLVYRVAARKITNLRTNRLEAARGVLGHPDECKRHFSEYRWMLFRHDVRFFRERQSPDRWDSLQTDHGYNGTPVWNILGTVLSNLSPASNRQLYSLALLDPLYLLAACALIWWAFGWRVLAVALLVFATNFPSRFYWTGGSFLRWDWLFYLVAAICCLRKDRPLLAGAALAYAALLRVFPVFVFVGPVLALGWHLFKHRKLDLRWQRFFTGAALIVVLLVPFSMAVAGSPAVYRDFIRNTAKHKETPLTNHMGLRTVMAWRPSERGSLLRDSKLIDPWQQWKEARVASFREARPLYAVILIGFLALVGLATRHAEPWMAACFGVALIPFGVELTSYYYAFILGVAFLWEKRDLVGRLLLALTAFTQFIAWAPIPTMSHWLDQQYTSMSVATLIVFGWIVWLFRKAQGTAEGHA